LSSPNQDHELLQRISVGLIFGGAAIRRALWQSRRATVLHGCERHVRPPGIVHTFFNPTADPVRFLVWLTPGEFSAYFEELFAMLHAEPSWPPADRRKLDALLAKYDQHPPPGPHR